MLSKGGSGVARGWFVVRWFGGSGVLVRGWFGGGSVMARWVVGESKCCFVGKCWEFDEVRVVCAPMEHSFGNSCMIVRISAECVTFL